MTEKDARSANDEIDLLTLFDLLARSRKLIVLVAGVFLLFGALWMIVAPPMYRADITVQVEDSSDMATSALNNVVGSLSSLFNVKATDDGEIEILRSRMVTDSAVEQLHLYIEAKPKRLPVFGRWIARHTGGLPRPGLFGWGGYAWGQESIHVTQFDVPREFEGDSFTVLLTGANQYRLSGSDLDGEARGVIGQPLAVKTAAGPLTLLVSSITGHVGTAFVVKRHSHQKVLDRFRQDLTIAEKGKDQSGIISVTYDDADPVRGSQILNVIADSYVRQNQQRKIEASGQSLEFLKGQLPDIRNQLELAENRLNDYENSHKVVDLTEQAKAILQQSVQTQATLLDLQRKRAELLATMGPRHPGVLAIEQQIADTRAAQSSQDSALSRLPNNQLGYARLERDAKVQQQIYVNLLNSIQQLELVRAGGTANVRIVDRAVVPEEPVRPRGIIILPVALMAGLLFGVAIAFARTVLVGRITDPVDIERRTLLEVTAVIPASDAQRQITRAATRGIGGSSVLALRMPRDPSVEAIRNLRVTVQFALAERPSAKVLLVTGPTAGVGKSFTSSNLAVLMGGADKRVLLIDADLRRGHLRSQFGVTASAGGLSGLLRQAASIDDAITRSVAPNVDLLSTGTLVNHADELFEASHVTDVIRSLADRYDLIIVDSPPVLPVTDTAILAPVADLVLLVTKSGVTTSGEILETTARLQRAGVAVNHVVFNGFRAGLRSQEYGYGDYYKTDYYRTDDNDRTSRRSRRSQQRGERDGNR